MSPTKPVKPGFTTTILHSDRKNSVEHGALHKPVHHSAAFGYATAEELAATFQNRSKGFAYSRQGNPTVAALEDKISQMEQGIGSVCFATGMGAIAATCSTLLRAGDHLVASSFLFGNTDSYFKTLTTHGIEISLVDATSVDNVRRACRPNTKAVFVETIANPCCQVSDMDEIGTACHQLGLLYIVDNTLTTPYLFLPKQVGASLVINSLTKFIGGHGNVLGGSVTDTGLFDWTRYANIYPSYQSALPVNRGLLQIRKKGLRDTGATLSPESAHLLSIGCETLALRLEKSCHNANQLAEFFDAHPLIQKVYYPGDKKHPQLQLANRLFRHNGAILSIDLATDRNPFAFLNKLKTTIISSNLGDNRTLAIPVAATIYYEMGAARRAEMGISDGLIRLSIGIEDLADLIEDFSQALAGS